MNSRIISLETLPYASTNGPLRRRADVPYYFVDRDGVPVYLTGSHNWSNMQECFSGDPDAEFDYDAYLEWMASHHHSYMRGWHWEQTSFDQFATERCPIRPMPFERTGPGLALDGLPKFDCTRFDPEYFDRLRLRVRAAAEKGIYVSVMLFEGWSTDVRRPNLEVSNPWDGHPLNAANNVNRVDGGADGNGGRLVHTLADPSITELQERYVAHVIDTVNDLDNVMYEIGNEHYEESFPWQDHMVAYIHEYEKSLPFQHPVGITSGGGGDDAVTNAQLERSAADFIAPRERNESNATYTTDPPVPDGSKIVLSDTDHLWGLGGTVDWVWKSFTRGLNPILMDPYEGIHGMDPQAWKHWGELNRRDHPLFEPIRCSMGYARWIAGQMNLETARACPDHASTRFCLADGENAVIYIPDDSDGTVTLDRMNSLYTKPGETYSRRWFNPSTGEVSDEPKVGYAEIAGAMSSPFGAGSVLILSSVPE